MRRFVIVSVLLASSAAIGATIPVSDPSFEDLPPGTGTGGTTTFVATGEWTIDNGSIRTAENGVVPFDGAQMLGFTETSGVSADIYQLIELPSLPEAVELTARFNAPTEHVFGLTLIAYDACCLPIDIGAGIGSASSDDLISDDDPETWEPLSLLFVLPAETSFLAVGLNSRIDGTPSYADSVSLVGVALCPSDLDGDGTVGFGDLTLVLGDWGTCGTDCPADFDGDGSVGFGDLTLFLGQWGPCDDA